MKFYFEIKGEFEAESNKDARRLMQLLSHHVKLNGKGKVYEWNTKPDEDMVNEIEDYG